jgi:hypothetical protein
MRAVAATAAVPLAAAARRVVVRRILRAAAHPEAALRTKAYLEAPAVAAALKVAERPVAVECKAEAQLAAVVPQAEPEQTQAAVPKVAEQPVAVECRAAAQLAAAARPAAVECKAEAQLAAVVPQAEREQTQAVAPKVAEQPVAVSLRLVVELLAVAELTAPKAAVLAAAE